MEQQTLFGGEVARPLASRMRPRTLEEFFGQEKLLGEGKILRQLIDSDNVPSMIILGPAGRGQNHAGAHYCPPHQGGICGFFGRDQRRKRD